MTPVRYEDTKGFNVYDEIRKAAASGLGWEDVIVKLKLSRTAASKRCVREIVLGLKP